MPARSEDLELVLQDGHSQSVTDTVWLDDQHLVSGSVDGSIKLWHVPTQRVLRTLWPQGDGNVQDLARVPEGVWACYTDGSLKLWDVVNGKLLRESKLPEELHGSELRLSEDRGGMLYVYGEDDTIRVIDPEGKASALVKLDAKVEKFAVSPDGSGWAATTIANKLYHGSGDKAVSLPINFATRWGIDSLVLSADASTLFVGSSVNWMQAWSLPDGKLLYQVPVTTNAPDQTTLSGPGYSGDNLGLAMADFDQDSLLVQTADGSVLRTAKKDGSTSKMFSFELFGIDRLQASPDRRSITGACARNGYSSVQVGVLDKETWRASAMGGRNLNFSSMATQDGTLYLSSNWNRVVSYDLASGQPARSYEVGYFPISVASRDTLYSGGNDGVLHAFDTKTGVERWSQKLSQLGARYGYGIRALTVSPDGQEIAVSLAAHPNKVLLLESATGKTKVELKRDQRIDDSLVYSPDGAQLFLCDSRSVDLYDRNYRKILHNWSLAANVSYSTRLVEVVNHPLEDAILALFADGNLVKIDRLRLDGKPEKVGLLPVREARSIRVVNNNLLISADQGALLTKADGTIIARYGDHLSSVSDALSLGDAILTTGWDARVKVWDKTTRQERATILSLDKGAEWLVLSPDYHFDGSEKAQDSIQWRWNGELFEISRFYERFYQPGLLARTINGNLKSEVPSQGLLGAQPPTVTLSDPKDLGNGFYQVEVKVAGDSSGPQDVRLYHNGHRVTGTSPFKIKAVKGENRLRASAFNKDLTVESVPARAEFVHAAPGQKSTLHIFAAAVNDYPNPLDFAVEDAKSFVEAFQPGLYDEVKKVTLFDAQANKAAIVEALAGIQCEPQDTLLVFLAGHGTILENRFHFLAHGSDGVSKENALSSQDLGQILAKLPATRQVLFLDTCHAGASAKDLAELLVEKDSPLVSSNQGAQLVRDQKLLARQAGTFLVAGSSPNTTAAEIPELGHGLFTYAVLQGLHSQGSEEVTVNELLRYLNERVPQLSQKFRGDPYGVWQFSAGQDFPIARPK